jgi:hypothetical protein
MSDDDFFALVGFVFILGLALLGLWMHFLGPCWLYGLSVIGDVPVRCLAVLAG